MLTDSTVFKLILFLEDNKIWSWLELNINLPDFKIICSPIYWLGIIGSSFGGGEIVLSILWVKVTSTNCSLVYLGSFGLSVPLIKGVLPTCVEILIVISVGNKDLTLLALIVAKLPCGLLGGLGTWDSLPTILTIVFVFRLAKEIISANWPFKLTFWPVSPEGNVIFLVF